MKLREVSALRPKRFVYWSYGTVCLQGQGRPGLEGFIKGHWARQSPEISCCAPPQRQFSVSLREMALKKKKLRPRGKTKNFVFDVNFCDYYFISTVQYSNLVLMRLWFYICYSFAQFSKYPHRLVETRFLVYYNTIPTGCPKKVDFFERLFC